METSVLKNGYLSAFPNRLELLPHIDNTILDVILRYTTSPANSKLERRTPQTMATEIQYDKTTLARNYSTGLNSLMSRSLLAEF
jgi:hypothetical protein